MVKRLFDIIFSGVGLLCLSPIFVVLAIWVKLDSKGPIFYRQKRVGKGNKDFELLKFRSMRIGSDSLGLITVGDRDPRITNSGYFIRRYKFDELPQLINVLRGDMSLVGPRPEVRRYVDMYSEEQLHVLDVLPGITDAASIKYRDESELLAKAEDSDAYYVNTIMPDKLRINLLYVRNHSLWNDFCLIFKTFSAIVNMPSLETINYLPRWAVLVVDTVLCFLSFIFCVWACSYFFNYTSNTLLLPIFVQAVILMLVQLPLFCFFRTFSGVLRYSTFIDTMKVMAALFSAAAIILFANFVSINFFELHLFYNTATLFYFFVSSTLLLSIRIGIKTIYETVMQHSEDVQRVMVYGTNDSALAIAKMLKSSAYNKYWPIGFISDHKDDLKDHELMGLKVFPRDESLISMLVAKNVKAIIISPYKLKAIGKGKHLSDFVENGINVLTAPGIAEIGHTTPATKRGQVNRIESINVEDLLERPTIQIDTENVKTIIENNVIMVTGAAGSIGSEIVRQVARYAPKTVVLFEIAESPLHDLSLELQKDYPNIQFVFCIGDVRDLKMVEATMQTYRPSLVFHAAAYKHVPLMESHPSQAVLANVKGTKNVADMAVKYGVERMVMISTDKAVNPTNVMGTTKRIAEMYCQSLFSRVDCRTKFITTRFGNVLGSNGSVIPYFKKQIAAGGPVTVTHKDIIRFFMTIPEACTLVMEAATLGNGGEIFVFDMGQPVKIYDLAKNMIRLAGYTPGEDIEIKITGLRPGEKLYEEVLNQKENTLPTINEKIMRAKVREVNCETISNEISELITVAERGLYDEATSMEVVKQMKKVVPEFKSNNSIFEKLDA